jgi:hypothetical protein
MMLPDMVTVESSKSKRVNFICGGDGMHLFRELINHHPNGIVPLTGRKACDEIYGDNLPTMIRNSIRLQLSQWHSREGFSAIAFVTPLHIVCNVLCDSRPPIILSDQFNSFPSTRVSSNRSVMMGLDNVMT